MQPQGASLANRETRAIGGDTEHLRSVFEVVGTGIAYCDGDGHVFANTMAQSLLGGCGDNLVTWCESQRLIDQETGDSLPPELHPMWRAFHHGESREVLVSVPVGTKQQLLLQVSGWPLHNDKQQQIGAACVVHDVSGEFWAAEEIAKAREEALRTARTKSTFLGTMSHELRTPLCAILGNAEILQTCDLDEEDAEIVGSIVRGACKLKEIVDDLLDYSSIDSARLKLQEGDVEPRVLADELCTMFSAQAKAKRLELFWHCEDLVPKTLRCDAHRLRRVVGHLIGNAIKFTDSGRIDIHVGGRQSNDQFELEISVKDTGIGIHEANRAHLFDPFIQADSSSTRRYGGTGLGLAICRDLIQLMGGQIDVFSEIDKGSTFTVAIPLIPAADIEEPSRRLAKTTRLRLVGC